MKITFTTKLAAFAMVAALSPLMAQDNNAPERRGPGGPGGGIRGGNPVIAALDLDKDGEVSAEELAKASASLATLDKNKDGKLTADEFRGAPGAGGGGAGRFGDPEAYVTRLMEGDTNKDGKLSKEEIPERLQGMMERVDTDKDGALSKEELEALVKNIGNGGGGNGGGEGGRGNRGGGNRPVRPAVPPTAPPAPPAAGK